MALGKPQDGDTINDPSPFEMRLRHSSGEALVVAAARSKLVVATGGPKLPVA